jgi:hypothetical protein
MLLMSNDLARLLGNSNLAHGLRRRGPDSTELQSAHFHCTLRLKQDLKRFDVPGDRFSAAHSPSAQRRGAPLRLPGVVRGHDGASSPRSASFGLAGSEGASREPRLWRRNIGNSKAPKLKTALCIQDIYIYTMKVMIIIISFKWLMSFLIILRKNMKLH